MTEQLPRAEWRRRKRKPKACRLCRTRKVRCDYGQPCSTCVRRAHPQLCSYNTVPVHIPEQPQNVSKVVTSGRFVGRSHSAHSLISAPETATTAETGTKTQLQPRSYDLLAVLDYIATSTIASCETDLVTAQVTFIGRRAHASVFRTLLSYLPEDTVPSSASVETVFGLTNRTISHPFATLWNTTTRVTVGDILGSMPPAETCLQYYRSYQQSAQPFFPVVPNALVFERHLCKVLERLPTEADEPSAFSTQLACDQPRAELAGYALIFAVLASGCQCCLVAETATDSHQLALSSRVFVACAFECLRLANFYVSPSPETVQATLILENVTCNDGNPGVAMGMLGMTAQHAQSLGMHSRCECTCRIPSCMCLQSWQPIWRAVLILDSRLSITYDRPPVSFTAGEPHDHLQSLVRAVHLEFWDCMFSLHCLQLQWQSLGTCGNRILIGADVVELYVEHAAQLQHLAFSAKSSLCQPDSVQTTLEKLVFQILLESFQGTLHRQAAVSMTLSTESRLHHFLDMVSKCCSVTETYLKLRRLSPIAKLSWEISRAAKSSAILLAAFEAVLCESLSGGLLDRFAELLSRSSSLRDCADDARPSSCHAGMETLTRLLQLQSRSPVTAGEGTS